MCTNNRVVPEGDGKGDIEDKAAAFTPSGVDALSAGVSMAWDMCLAPSRPWPQNRHRSVRFIQLSLIHI